ncbi:putative membrane protein [Propionispora sp. 2/2-37]|uniref:stage V sporulation protein AC n=1 Tax=Propionispora sp. 2/2-37 TaxID=1677858 RepID=UPI0006BB8CD8|nr:stage V sporulation protein AC [Propionispora sp. 2/2-37]CUH94058.1 putative membrane protein [Propionispora sp. 2/2-37]
MNQNSKEDREQQFQEKFNRVKPSQPVFKNLIWAFIVGGLICTLGQFIGDYFIHQGLGKKEAAAATSVVMVFLGAFFTGLGVYDDLGKYAGAGSIVPITGFANSVVSPAMEFKREGFIYGIGAKMFVIAGPVIVYGLVTAFAIGLIYWFRQGGLYQ